MLKATSVSKQYDAEPLFSGVDIVLNPGDRVGLVGPNGVGKSTLLRVLSGQEPPTHGHVALAPGTRVGHVGQQVPDPTATVGELLADAFGELHDLEQLLRRLERRMSAGDVDAVAAYGQAQDRWAALDGWRARSRLDDVRQRLGVDHLDDGTPLEQVSGGEQARLTLARALLEDPDLLVLDEPTNHLDADGIDWLGRWLAGFPGAVLAVSHDRAFLDRMATRIVELDGIHDVPQTYPGGWRAYRAEKARRWERLLLDYEAQQKDHQRWLADIARTKDQARGVEETVRTGIGADQARRYAKKVARKAKARERRLRRQMESVRWIARPQTRPPLSLAFPQHGNADDQVLSLRGVGIDAGGRTLLDGLDLTVGGGERIMLAGPNGCGKTSLLRVLAGERHPDRGVVTAAGPVELLPQTHDTLRTDVTVRDFFRSRVAVYADDAEALLAAHLFAPRQWDARLRNLSAGQLRRLLLAVLVNSPAPLLLLDEPTNYLDIDALEVVEEALRQYRGTLVLVSHDTWFASAVGVTRRWQVTDGGVRDEPVAAPDDTNQPIG